MHSHIMHNIDSLDPDMFDFNIPSYMRCRGIWLPRSPKAFHFIGLGTAGSAAIKYIRSKKITAKYTAITEISDLALTDGIEIIQFTSSGYARNKIKDRLIWYPDLDFQFVIPDKIQKLFDEDYKFILIAGLGGFTGTLLAESLSLALKSYGIPFHTICSLPLPLEGDERNTFAITTFNKLRMLKNFRYFDFKVLIEQYEDLPLQKSFEIGNEHFYTISQGIMQ